MSRRENFAQSIRNGDQLTGLFQKFPHYQTTEILAQSGIDFAVLDSEHAPFSADQLDACLLAGRAADLPVMVRVPSDRDDAILAALDMGASGVLVPHVDSAAKARAVVDAARYRVGKRGFSPSTRAGGYGTRGLDTYMDAADQETLVIAQIEDGDALDRLNEIFAVEGLDAAFIGRADLASSMRLGWNAPELDHAVAAIAQAAVRAGVACGAYCADPKAVARHREWGVSFLLSGSDQSSLKNGAAQVAMAMRAPGEEK